MKSWASRWIHKYRWSGDISFFGSRKMECNIDENTQNGSKTINRFEFKSCKANINLSTKKISLSSGAFSLIMSDMEAEGILHALNKKNREETFDSNSSHGTDTYTMIKSFGSKSFNITEQNLVMSFIKGNMADPYSMKNMIKEMTQGGFDPAKIKQLGEKLKAMQGNQKGKDSFPIKIQLQIHGIWSGPVTEHSFCRETSRIHGTKATSGTNATVLPLAAHMATELSGTYTRGKHGRDQIHAEFKKEEFSSNHDKGCSPATLINYCTIKLKKN